jgi:hypothetical protein
LLVHRQADALAGPSAPGNDMDGSLTDNEPQMKAQGRGSVAGA